VAGGSSVQNVAKVTIFLTDMSHFNEVVELRRTFFSPPYRPTPSSRSRPSTPRRQ